MSNEILVSFAKFLVQNNLVISFDYNNGWEVTKQSDYVPINLIDHLSVVTGVGINDNNTSAKVKLKEFIKNNHAQRRGDLLEKDNE